jgi:hypothetical protein
LRTPPRAAHDNNNIKGRTTTTSYETTGYKLDVEVEEAAAAAAQPQPPIKQQLGNIAHVLQASGGRLEQLYKKVLQLLLCYLFPTPKSLCLDISSSSPPAMLLFLFVD